MEAWAEEVKRSAEAERAHVETSSLDNEVRRLEVGTLSA
jgi:hypothetical protein